MVRWLVILVMVAGVLWGGYWFVGARAARMAVDAGLEEAAAQGWRIETSDVSIAGFPNRFDVTLSDADVTTPDGLRVVAPFLQAFALSYRPNHVIAVAPPRLTLTDVAGRETVVTSDDMRASVIVTLPPDPVLDRTTLTAEALRIDGAPGTVTLARGLMATRQAGGPTVHDVTVDLADLAVPGMAQPFDVVNVDALVTLDRPIGAGDPPRLDSLELRASRIVWGDVRVEVTGRASVTASGAPRGDFTLRVTGWQVLLDLATEAGLLPPGQVPLLMAGLTGLSDADGTASVPVSLADGRVTVLGLPVAPLPRLPVPGGG